MEKKLNKEVETTTLIFCANDQEETEHKIEVDNTYEIVLTCKECGRALKLPEGTTKKDIEKYAKRHKEENEGQKSQEQLDEKKRKILESFK